MERYEPIFEALNASGARYVVVGGVAVNLHGHTRFTQDLDLVVDLEPEPAAACLRALSALGFRPRLPVVITGFADAATRERWFTEKNMLVFQLYREPSRLTIDLFVRSPIDFEALWTRATDVALSRTHVRIASLDDLIAIKRAAGRPQDLVDVEVLERIRDLPPEDAGS